MAVPNLGVRAATALLLAHSASELERLGRLRHFQLVVQGLLPRGVLVLPARRAAARELRAQKWEAVPPARRAAVQQQLAPLYATLRAVWKLPWSNEYKQLYWQLMYNALPTVARLHTPRAQPCPCGQPAMAPPDGTPARPDWVHVFWECHVAQAVLQELSRSCGGAAVTPVQLLLMRPPGGVLADVWRIACLAALNTMWRFRAPYKADATLEEAIIRAGSAVAGFWALLADFVRVGRWPRCWRQHLGPVHPFMCLPRSCGSLQLHRPGGFGRSP